jgi:hypothetical protein
MCRTSAALFINHNFYNGRSGKSETFGNEVLASEEDFTIKSFEVWGFDWL